MKPPFFTDLACISGTIFSKNHLHGLKDLPLIHWKLHRKQGVMYHIREKYSCDYIRLVLPRYRTVKMDPLHTNACLTFTFDALTKSSWTYTHNVTQRIVVQFQPVNSHQNTEKAVSEQKITGLFLVRHYATAPRRNFLFVFSGTIPWREIFNFFVLIFFNKFKNQPISNIHTKFQVPVIPNSSENDNFALASSYANDCESGFLFAHCDHISILMLNARMRLLSNSL